MTHAFECSMLPVRAELHRGVLQPEPSSSLDLEGLLSGHRAIDELQLRSQDRYVQAIARQRAQRKQRLQPGDASARDQHMSTGAGHVLALGRARRRTSARTTASLCSASWAE